LRFSTCSKAFDDDIDALLFVIYDLQEGCIQAFEGNAVMMQ